MVANRSTFTTGRTIGIILLLQLMSALTLPFILSKPITFRSPEYFTAVAEHAFQIRASVLLSFVGSGLTVYLGITAFQVFRLCNKSVALLFLVICAISCTLDIVQAGNIMSMLSISREFLTSNPADAGLYKVVGSALSSVRRSSHYTQLLGIGAWMFVFYIALLRFKLIPQVLAITALIGVILQFTGVTLMMLLGYPTIGEMAMPLLPIQIGVGVWLITKGFRDSTLTQPEISNIKQVDSPNSDQ